MPSWYSNNRISEHCEISVYSSLFSDILNEIAILAVSSKVVKIEFTFIHPVIPFFVFTVLFQNLIYICFVSDDGDFTIYRVLDLIFSIRAKHLFG